MSRFTFITTGIADVFRIDRHRISDDRGFLSRLFCAEEFASIGFSLPIAQINHTFTRQRGAVRGFHFQHPPHAEDKLVTCVRGEIYDVALDLRAGSPTFLSWHAERLTAENARSLLIPQGVAHAFQALTDDCELVYVHSRAYAPQAEGGIHINCRRIGVTWPLPVAELSARDTNHPFVEEDFKGISL